MGYVEVSTGVFERELSENETFIKLICDSGLAVGRENWTISSQASFKLTTTGPSADVTALLRRAWIQLRYRQPSIAAYVIDSTIRYEVPDQKALVSWVEQTFIVQAANTTAADVIANRKPTGLAVLHYFPHTYQIVFQSSHWRTDGIGVFYILDELFDLLAQVAAKTAKVPHWGDETSRLVPCIEEAAGLPHEATPETTEIGQRFAGTFALVANAIGVKYKGDTNTAPEGTYIKHVSLTEAQTSAVITCCKTQKISVTSAFHASVAAANYQFANEADNSKPYTSTIRFGLRKYLPEKYNTQAYGAGLYTSGWMFQLPSQEDNSWLDTTKSFNAEYRKGYTAVLPAHRQYSRIVTDLLRNTQPPSTGPSPSDFDISSVGSLDRFISPIHKAVDGNNTVLVEVTDVTLGVEMLSRQMVCFVWTFRGRLNLQIVYNGAYHDGEQAQRMLEFVRDNTLTELGVEL